MHASRQLKKEFLKKWIHGIKLCCSSKKEMSLLERKKKIKLSADIAMASAKTTTSSWSKALISEARKDEENKIFVDNLLSPESRFKLQNCTHQNRRLIRSKKILKKSCNIGKRAKNTLGRPSSNLATCIAKRLVKKRIHVLQRLVPGGESMDEFSLIKEALDYMLALKVQVDGMRSTLVTATKVLN